MCILSFAAIISLSGPVDIEAMTGWLIRFFLMVVNKIVNGNEKTFKKIFSKRNVF